MIVNERLVTYLDSLTWQIPEPMQELEQWAKRSADHTSFDAVIAFVYAAFATTETCFRDRNGSGVFCSFNA